VLASTGGILAAEFVPGLPADGGVISRSKGVPTYAIASDVAMSPSDGDLGLQRAAADGLAEVVRAFDQSSAIAQAKAARGAGQGGPEPVSGRTVTASPFLGQAGLASFDLGAKGSGSADTSINSNAAALAQAIQIAQSVVASSGVRVSSGMPGEQALASGMGTNTSAGTFDLSQVGTFAAVSGTTGANSDGTGSGASGEPGSGRLAGEGSGVNFRGEAGGAPGRGGVASAQKVLGATFSAAMSSAGGMADPSLVESENRVPASAAAAPVASAAVVADFSTTAMPGSGVSSAVTVQTLGGVSRTDASSAVATAQSPVTADQLPVALDRTAIELARLRGGMLTLELAPADLGRLSFEMRIDDSGAAFVAIRLADDTVRALVENAAGALRDSLSREGFKLDSFTVSSGFASPEQRENSQNQTFAETSNRRVQSPGSSGGSRDGVQSRASNTQVRPGTSSLSLFA